MPSIYKITYPNGKIYIGQDSTDSVNYFGSASSDLIEKDLTHEQLVKLTITKEILWYVESVDSVALNAKETEWILKLESNNPSIGYNRRPKFKLADD